METTIKTGDILCGTWGCGMVIPCFYKVIAITEKRLKVIELDKRMVRATDGGYFQQGYEMPVEQPKRLNAEVALAKPCKDWEDHWKIGGRYDARYLHLWDGKPIWADYMD